MRYYAVGAVVLAFLALLGLLVWTRNAPLVFAPEPMMNALWATYKLEDLEASTTRTIDRTQNNITTSEGESYTMLRAVWMDDKPTFDSSWQWTEDNLHRPSDHLFSWLFGELPGGSYGVLTNENGQNAASDADTDIALALIFAYARWQDPSYLASAKLIVADIWSKEVITINGTPYLTADDLEKTSASSVALIDPSYLQPFAYRIFALVDPSDPWNELVDSSYSVLQESMTATLDASSTADLPPDWVAIDKTTGALSATGDSHDSNFGFDALRVPYNLALDYEWYGDARDLKLLSQMSFLDSTWKSEGLLDTTYSHAGAVVENYETPAMYGGTLGYFLLEDPSSASAIYRRKIIANFDAQTSSWKTPLAYYDDSWSWFGIGLYNHLLPNLAASLPPSAYP